MVKKQKVGDDLGVCVLNLQIMYEKSKSLTRPCDKRDMWLYGRKPFTVCNHPAMFGSHRYCGSGDKMFLIYHVTTCSKGGVT